MKSPQMNEQEFLERIHEKIASQGQNFLLDCAKILVEKEFSQLPENSKNPEKNPVILFKIEVRKQNNSLRTKVDLDIF